MRVGRGSLCRQISRSEGRGQGRRPRSGAARTRFFNDIHAQVFEAGCNLHPDGGTGDAVGVRCQSQVRRRISPRRRSRRPRRRLQPLPQQARRPSRSRNGKRSAARSTIPQECHTSRKRLAATGQPIAQFLVIERGEKKLLQLAVPPVALIQPGVQVKIDNAEATGVKYVVCTPGECLALGEINRRLHRQAEEGRQRDDHHAQPAGQAGELRDQPGRLHLDL